MKSVKGFLRTMLILLVLAGAIAFVVINYSWVFSKRVKGEVVDVQRVTAPTAILGSKVSESQMYSYSILIQGEDGRLYSAASEDRQWQVVKKGYCVDALLYRYPPWRIDQGNTFFNARVEQIRICPGQKALPDAPSTPTTEAPVGDTTPTPTPAPEHK